MREEAGAGSLLRLAEEAESLGEAGQRPLGLEGKGDGCFGLSFVQVGVEDLGPSKFEDNTIVDALLVVACRCLSLFGQIPSHAYEILYELPYDGPFAQLNNSVERHIVVLSTADR